MREDPAYRKISKRFHENPEEFADKFARAWFKLLHRDLGPRTRYLGPEAPSEKLIWQDPIPSGNRKYNIEEIKQLVTESGLSSIEMIETAWASASTFRDTDKRGGANGARIRLEPQRNWEVNKPLQLARVLSTFEEISLKTGVSIADIIVLAGNSAIEKASGLTMSFTPGRGDATQEDTDVPSFSVLEPLADGFRNYQKEDYIVTPEEMLLDKAHLMGLTAPEMTVLLGGLRSLGISSNGSGILTNTPGTLNNDFFVNLLDINTELTPSGMNTYEVNGLSTDLGQTVSRVDLLFASNSELRALAEVYATDDSKEKFILDFSKAWTKVMELDRFDTLI
jgi:catalase-peroxidase